MGDKFPDDSDFPFDPETPVVWVLTDVIDLHSVPPRDVLPVVQEWLEEAKRQRWPVGRIIHGKGLGVQRAAVRQLLSRTPWVLRFSDAPLSAGAHGATIVDFRNC